MTTTTMVEAVVFGTLCHTYFAQVIVVIIGTVNSSVSTVDLANTGTIYVQ